MSSLVHKTQIVPFINKATDGTYDWVQIKKSTEFQFNPNVQTKTFDFISSKVQETEVDSYQPSLTQSLTMFKGEADYDLFFDMFYTMPTSEDAHRDLLIVYYQEEGTDAAGNACYKAHLADAVIQVGALDSVAETISITLSLNGLQNVAVCTLNGDVDVLEGTWTDDTFSGTFTVTTTEETTDGTEDSTTASDGTYTAAITLDGDVTVTAVVSSGTVTSVTLSDDSYTVDGSGTSWTAASTNTYTLTFSVGSDVTVSVNDGTAVTMTISG